MANLRHKVRMFLRGLGDWARERRMGVETGATPLSRRGAPAGGERYEPTPYEDFERIIAEVPLRPGDVLLDAGSGKGRVLMLAGRYPFRRVIGVEISEELNAAARRNIAAVRAALACRDFEFFTGDAAAFEIPDDVTHLYLFNPFGEEAVDRLFSNVRRSLARRPRDVFAIYYNPRHAAVLERRHSLLKLREVVLDRSPSRVVRCDIYRFGA